MKHCVLLGLDLTMLNETDKSMLWTYERGARPGAHRAKSDPTR